MVFTLNIWVDVLEKTVQTQIRLKQFDENKKYDNTV